VGAVAVHPAFTDHDTALREADMAMYIEKERRRNIVPGDSTLA
jgi:diguanylate cyclase